MSAVRPRSCRRDWRTRVIAFAAAALLVVLPISGFAAAPVAGTDYLEIPGGTAFDPQPGKVEVVEVFGYTCSHCARFEPALTAWKKRLPADVDLVLVPAPFGGHWIPYAQAFYAAQSMGLVERTHAAVFQALHDERSLPINRATPQEIAGFYAGFGADPVRFAEAMTSDATQARLQRARDFLVRSDVQGTPTLIVNGKYLVLGDSASDTLRIAGELVARERAARR